MRALLALLFPVVVGCATTSGTSKQHVEDLPEWMTDPDGLRFDLIEHFLAEGHTSRALEIIRIMRNEGSDSPNLDLYQGRALRAEGMLEDAERLLESARKRMPRSAAPHVELCVLNADMKRIERAIDFCDRAANLNEKDAKSWNNLGYLLLGVNRVDEAQDALENAVDLDGTSRLYRNNLGLAQAANGEPDRALRTFMSAGSRADANYNVGTAIERYGDQDDAVVWYDRALKYDASHDLASDALERLQTAPDDETSPNPKTRLETPDG